MQGVAFMGGEYVPLADARISVMTHAFNYGTATFEGLRGYWNAAEEQIYLFRMREHFVRLHNSARVLAIDLSYTVDELGAICREVLRRSAFRKDVYVRPIAYKSGLGIGVSMTGVPDAFVMYGQPMGNYIEVDRGIRCCVNIIPYNPRRDSPWPAPAEDEVERFIAAQQQLSDLINQHLGFRGYLMMMRLQRAENLRDLHDFLPDFAQALIKRIGMDAATAIVAPLERLIVRGA